MRNRFLILLLLILVATGIQAQPGGQPDKKQLRIVDTLTQQERLTRNPVLLRSELDSLIKDSLAKTVPVKLQEPVKEKVSRESQYLVGIGVALLLLILSLLILFYRHQKKTTGMLAKMQRQLRGDDEVPDSPLKKDPNDMAREKSTKSKTTAQSLEKKVSELNAEIHKLSKENESLNRVMKEYNGIQHDYDALKHGFAKAFKVKNYPGYDKNKGDGSIMQAVLDTENSVAIYAYEKFIKPVLVIADANKNNPARINEEDRQKLMDLLVSLSLLYIEYLYLRVQDLSVGGKIVERIHGFRNGNGLDPSLLKELSTEHGSRALVIKLALEKMGFRHLSYPVFDETNLNNS
ncbi:MAG TPA: hypothetical protein VLJ68_11070 [Chitinophagaceae bacterium]|nr:hypothetical protein [Chitinophagaceae bacterium]